MPAAAAAASSLPSASRCGLSVVALLCASRVEAAWCALRQTRARARVCVCVRARARGCAGVGCVSVWVGGCVRACVAAGASAPIRHRSTGYRAATV